MKMGLTRKDNKENKRATNIKQKECLEKVGSTKVNIVKTM